MKAFYQGQPGEHFVLEEAGQFRVGLRGADRQRLLSLVGRAATAIGRFHFDEKIGGYIQVEALRSGEGC